MTTTIHNVIQGSDEWLALRCGMLTASDVKLIMTPTLKPARNDHSRAHVYELAAQRITGHVDPGYLSDSMARGMADEPRARKLYSERYAPVQQVGFVTREFFWGILGCSPDGFVGDDGMIEIKSRAPKHQVKTAVECGESTCPDEFMLQVQTGLLITGRSWCDVISYCGGLHLVVARVFVSDVYHEAIHDSACAFEAQVVNTVDCYQDAVTRNNWLLTERTLESDDVIVGSE